MSVLKWGLGTAKPSAWILVIMWEQGMAQVTVQVKVQETGIVRELETILA